ncbi:MAG: EVE domain-containing protein [Pseudomonadales bacterium]|nr:EVE domain-containing protein [Pseudomonadales bacterium]
MHWLFKTEPGEFSIDDLEADGTARWDGIRNYQARNFLRDQVALGEGVFIYHSSCARPGIAGQAEVIKTAYPDPAQFDATSPYFDPKASGDDPRWFCVDIRWRATFAEVLPLARLKQLPALADMVLLKQGRLSVQPVTAEQWQVIEGLAE